MSVLVSRDEFINAVIGKYSAWFFTEIGPVLDDIHFALEFRERTIQLEYPLSSSWF
jgi:hypothetical protein